MKSYPQRKSPRLQGYDYTQSGAYFVTICTHNRQYFFDSVEEDVMWLNNRGEIAHEEIASISSHWKSVDVDLFVVMPNHVHLIILLETPMEKNKIIPRLGTVVGNYKSGVTRRIRAASSEPEMAIWQGRYHDHIIRNEKNLERIRQYILFNPALWSQDKFYEPDGK